MTQKSESPPILQKITQLRERLHKPHLDIEQLQLDAASQDPGKRERAQKILDIKWTKTEHEIKPEDVEPVDLKIFFKERGFTREHIIRFARQLVAINLMNGCGGSCYFCCLNAEQPTHKFTFESIKWFIEEYREFLPQNLSFYWDSDPFEYEDIDQRGQKRSYVDIYRLYRKIFPHSPHSITTSLPRGSQANFIELFKAIATRYSSSSENGACLSIRLSVSKHNIERIEATLEIIYQDLKEEGMPDEFISKIFNEFLKFETRTDITKLNTCGLIFKLKQDPFIEIISPSCTDGLLLDPLSLDAVMMTACTVVDQQGYRRVPIKSDQVEQLTPLRIHRILYSHFKPESIERLNYIKHLMLPRVTKKDGNPYHLLNTYDDLTLQLGRETLSFMLLLLDLEDLSSATILSEDKKTDYLQSVLSLGRERIIAGAQLMQDSIKRYSAVIEDHSETETIDFNFLIQLLESYIYKLQLIIQIIELVEVKMQDQNQKLRIAIVSAFARVLRGVGVSQISSLETLISDLLSIANYRADLDMEAMELYKYDSDLDRLNKLITNFFIGYFGYPQLTAHWPLWAQDFKATMLRENV